MTCRSSATTSLTGALVTMLWGYAAAQPAPDLSAAASDAYIFGYPLVTMELTRRGLTNVAAPEGKLAPMGIS